jgi:hypothetical protein
MPVSPRHVRMRRTHGRTYTQLRYAPTWIDRKACLSAGTLRNFRGEYRNWIANKDGSLWSLATLTQPQGIPIYAGELGGPNASYAVSKGLVNRLTELQAQVRTHASPPQPH